MDVQQETEAAAAATEETASGGRRASLVTIQHLLSRAPHTTLPSPPSESGRSSANESRDKQGGEQEVIHVSPEACSTYPPDPSSEIRSERNPPAGSPPSVPRDGVPGAHINPFHASQLDSASRGHEGVESNLGALLAPPPGFQSSPLDFQPEVQTVGHGDESSWPQKDRFRPWTSDPFKECNLFDKSPGIFPDPFRPPSPRAGGLLQASQPVLGNHFHSASTSKADWFQALPADEDKPEPFGDATKQRGGLFSPSSTGAVDPFPSPIQRDLFQDLSSLDDPFGSTPSKQHDPFQDVSSGTTDWILPRPSTSRTVSSTPGFHSPSETTSDSLVSPGPSTEPPHADRPTTSVVLTTPGGTKHAVLQPTPFSQARSLSVSHSRSPPDMTHVTTFRRPPKPLPRTRPRRPEKPTEPEATPPPTPALRPLPKPPVGRKPQTPEPVEPENHQVFEDVLLTGQERCVEDWPDDSPELNPEFRPSGRLRLRRESLLLRGQKMDSDGGSGEDQDGARVKKKEKKFRMSLLSRRGSKEKFVEDLRDGRSRTLPNPRKSSQECFSDAAAAEDDDAERTDYKKKPLRTKVTQLLRRASAASAQQDEAAGARRLGKKSSAVRRWSEGTWQEDGGEEEEGGGGGGRGGSSSSQHEERRKNKVKIKLVPRRGFTISSKKEKSQDEGLGLGGFAPRARSQGDAFEDVGEGKVLGLKDDFTDDELSGHRAPGRRDDHDDDDGMNDCKPKKPLKMKLLHVARRSPQNPSRHQAPDPVPRRRKDDGLTGHDLLRGGEMFFSDEEETYKLKTSRTPTGLGRNKVDFNRDDGSDDPPGAASADFASPDFTSEAAQAEWVAAQRDERALAGWEDDDNDGDTDSLMEWWNNVEQWDEVPSDDENVVMEEDESKSFSVLADKVLRGLRVFNKVFTERAEVLWQSIITLHAIADDIRDFHQKAKIAGITGGTTTAVGGVTAIAGLVMAPFTFGVSLVVTAVGVGVATAGGIASASAAISDNVNNMHDRKKVEGVLLEYEDHLLHIGKILHFVDQGVYKLRGHPFLRSGTQHYSEDWEVRRAVQVLSLVDSPVMRATALTDAAVATVQGLFKGMDKFFIKDSRELKKGCRREAVSQIKQVANMLNDTVVELNAVREELDDATGGV